MNQRAGFETLYAGSTDPWSYRTSWYERRKRALLLAALTRPRFASTCELGCSNGELTAELAARSDAVVGVEGVDTALAAARVRLQDAPHVRLEQHWLPDSWPAGRFDLIVVSEIAYYLERAGLDELSAFCLRALQPAGCIVVCQWRHPVPNSPLGAAATHRLLRQSFPWPRTVSHEEDDFILEVWDADEKSVARREGLLPARPDEAAPTK